MAKIEVTDEMVVGVMKLVTSLTGRPVHKYTLTKRALAAAFNPPPEPEPEILVTVGMMFVGAGVLRKIFKAITSEDVSREAVTRIYRAMEHTRIERQRIEEREAEPKAQPGGCDHDWILYGEFSTSAQKRWPPGVTPRATDHWHKRADDGDIHSARGCQFRLRRRADDSR